MNRIAAAHITDASRGGRRKRGSALLLVLLMLAMALAVSYSSVRYQNQTFKVQRNGARRGAAQQLAQLGLSLGMKRMTAGDWAGTETSFTESLGPYESVRVSYATGDARLVPGTSDYQDKYPWRVTITAEGYAIDSNNPQCIAKSTAEMVMQLIPRQLGAELPKWDDTLPNGMRPREYAVNQCGTGSLQVEVPCQFGGYVRLQGMCFVARDIGWSDTVCTEYFSDLKLMNTAHLGDNRPFNQRITWWHTVQPAREFTLLLTTLGMNSWSQGPAYWPSWPTGLGYPAQPQSYRLFTGGKSYAIPLIGGVIAGTSYTPDTLTNPMGMFRCDTNLELRDNAYVNGTLITQRTGSNDIILNGHNIVVDPVNVMPLDGETVRIQMQVLMSGDDIIVKPNTTGTIKGLIACPDSFTVESAPQDATQVTFVGQVLANYFYMQARSEWIHTSSWWDTARTQFLAQKATGIKYFPDWLRVNRGLNPQPVVRAQGPYNPTRMHWFNPDVPIFVPKTADGGLRWEFIRMAETTN